MLGLEREAFYRMTMSDYLRACYAEERREQMAYEKQRWLAYWIVKSSMSKTDSIKSAVDLVKFYWETDTKNEQSPLTQDEKERIKNLLDGISSDNSSDERAHIGANSGVTTRA